MEIKEFRARGSFEPGFVHPNLIPNRPDYALEKSVTVDDVVMSMGSPSAQETDGNTKQDFSLQESVRQLLAKISPNHHEKGANQTSSMEIEVGNISKTTLKRIDPKLRSRIAGKEEELYPSFAHDNNAPGDPTNGQMADLIPSERDMQVDKGGRQGVDNAIIVQELIHSMAKKKGRGSVMAIKLDFEKAYDHLERSFVRDTLNLYKFPSHLVSLIMSCVSTSSISILVNGGALGQFYPLRGIRQGDPLSPYLFILCMEVFGALIEDKCKAKLWNSVKASQRGLAFSHVFFANDLLLFTRAFCFSQEQIGRIALLLGIIAIKALLNERGLGIQPVYPMCNIELETIIHALRDCPKAQCFWNSFSPPFSSSLFYGLQLVDWLKTNYRSSRHSGVSDIEWGPQRNLLDETLARAAKVAYLGINGKQTPIRNKIQVKWIPPSSNWFKLNSNGSSMGNPGLAGGGGIIRNKNGEWVEGYARAIGITTSVAAKLWALRDGIRLCIALKLPAVEIELDAKVVLDLVGKESSNPNSLDALVVDCKEGLKNIPFLRIKHYYKEANKCTDNLARRGALLGQDFIGASFELSGSVIGLI
ncbi:uncharacterized protein LOC142620320 [Castanea sativa]|uniref:uncharacterized protein LOC142620320 n=1 Tax=Castanea sativa TaxID=21020 RepID=UPI003F653340